MFKSGLTIMLFGVLIPLAMLFFGPSILGFELQSESLTTGAAALFIYSIVAWLYTSLFGGKGIFDGWGCFIMIVLFILLGAGSFWGAPKWFDFNFRAASFFYGVAVALVFESIMAFGFMIATGNAEEAEE